MAVGSHIPLRTCIACRRKKSKFEMIRFVQKDGNVVLDAEQRYRGRGAYTCADYNCLKLAIQKKAFYRSFKSTVKIDPDQLGQDFDLCLRKK
ncbi:YlxR family protein [candidate division KSB1 bacterium]|nr:MAG: YlxR family protein [candidate division KSB1 bacterium]